jgi:predicted ArsR family transcriptional regulator
MRQLARDYGVDVKAITKFRDRHEDTISDMRADIESEFSGLWIAQKAERLAEMIELYGDAVSPRDRETKLSVLRHAAEELGQIPNRTTIDFAQPVQVIIEGADDV